MSARERLQLMVRMDAGSMTVWSEAEVSNALDAYRAEVLNEAAEILRARAAQYPTRRIFAAGLRHGALALAKAAMERGKCNPTGADATPDFFQLGRVYTDGNGYRAPELTTIFRVEHVTRHPDRGHLRAIGWSRTGEPGAKWHGDFQDEGEFDGWSEIAAGGEG
jgi:hypothetical protein